MVDIHKVIGKIPFKPKNCFVYLPIQLATRCGEKSALSSTMYQRASRVSGGVQTLHNVSAYQKPTWHFDAKFVDRQAYTRANVQKAPGHGHFFEMKNSAYHCPYDLIDNKVNAIYIVYKIRDYDSAGTEHNYLFSWERTMRLYGVAGNPYNYMDISNFPTSYYSPC